MRMCKWKRVDMSVVVCLHVCVSVCARTCVCACVREREYICVCVCVLVDCMFMFVCAYHQPGVKFFHTIIHEIQVRNQI